MLDPYDTARPVLHPSLRTTRLNMKKPPALLLLALASAGLLAWLAGCVSRPETAAAPPVQAPSPPPAPPSAPRDTTVSAPKPAKVAPSPSNATTARAYRRDAAEHLYSQNRHRVFQGKLPPLLHAIGVLQVEVDGRGRVTGTSWMRAPKHAPDVMAEIERSVRAAAPFPAPARMGRVTYTDTWLWDRSGQFQLDTLTEGQL